jgi:hypothetical protein
MAPIWWPRGRTPDVLCLVPPTEDVVHLNRVWKLEPDTSPLMMLELWRPTDTDDEEVRRFLLAFGRRVLAAAGVDLTDAPVRCPWCATFQTRAEALLGRLGRLTHFRCRYCGGRFLKEVE